MNLYEITYHKEYCRGEIEKSRKHQVITHSELNAVAFFFFGQIFNQRDYYALHIEDVKLIMEFKDED